MRQCKICNEEKEDLWFRSRLTKAGNVSYEKVCRPCAAKQGNSRHRDKRYLMQKSFDEMSADQKNVCAICKGPPQSKGLCVDHCHRTGLVRGLLCTNCNLGIGCFKEDIKLLELAINYLKG